MCKLLKFVLFLHLIAFAPFAVKAQGSGQALTLDGNYSYLLSSTSNRGVTNQVTVEAWVKTTAYKYEWVAGKYDRYGAERGYHLFIKDGFAAFAGRDGSGVYRHSGYSKVYVNDGNWHHLAGTCDGNTWAIYVDGVLQESIKTNYAFTSLVNNAPLAIGKYFLVDDEFFVGQIDELKIWSTALTVEQIRTNMCSKLTVFPSALIAYFNFDNKGTATAIDLSTQGLNATLQNATPSQSWQTSGAPIGDQSVYRYPSRWDSSLEMVTDHANFSVSRVDPAIKGFHIYTIQSPPATSRGIESPEKVQEYFGVFKVGETSKKYKVYYKNYGLDCGGMLYRRQNNADANWNQVADTTASPIMLYTATDNYGEYAATERKVPTVKISGPAFICAASTATLKAVYTGTAKVLWSTGATTASIDVSKGGKYWVELTTGPGCIARDEVEVSYVSEPKFSLPAQVSLCAGEQAVLDATTAGATYSWSNGQNTPSITATTPDTYRVTVTINNCQFEREVVVAEEECLKIPNIITPNADGKNDAFVVKGIEPNVMELKIISRWGKTVYQHSGYDNTWSADGLPAGLYIYQLTSTRNQQVYKGWVEVIR